MKGAIITEGGRKIGFGHISRCVALLQAFEEYGARLEFFVNSDENTLDLLNGRQYKILNWIRRKKEIYHIIKNNDFIIIDSYLAEKHIYDNISQINNAKIVMIDDNNRIEYPEGIVINPSIYGDKLVYLKKKEIKYLLGKNYILLRKEFWRVPKKRIKNKVRDILITLGGMNHFKFIYNLRKHLKSQYDFNFIIVDPSKLILTAQELINLMLEADICISAGGQSLYELIRVGVPTIGICFAKNQRLNLEQCQKEKLIQYAGSHKDNNLLIRISRALQHFLPYEERIKISQSCSNFIDGKGVRRIAKKIIKEFN